jgi:hypothetical protein
MQHNSGQGYCNQDPSSAEAIFFVSLGYGTVRIEKGTVAMLEKVKPDKK